MTKSGSQIIKVYDKLDAMLGIQGHKVDEVLQLLASIAQATAEESGEMVDRVLKESFESQKGVEA